MQISSILPFKLFLVLMSKHKVLNYFLYLHNSFNTDSFFINF